MSRLQKRKDYAKRLNLPGPKYVIRLPGGGYYGAKPYTGMLRIDAHLFASMKDARKQLNRLNGRLMKDGPSAEIEPA